MAFHLLLTALQFDEVMAIQMMFRAKYSLNYAVHAAAQQMDTARLAEGIYSIDADQARKAAEQYIRENMMLDENNEPLPESYLRTRAEIIVFKVINDDHLFPYTYIHMDSGFHTTLERPGVIMIMKIEYPRTFHVLGPITWDIRGSSELVY